MVVLIASVLQKVGDTTMLIRDARPEEDEILIQHYRALWESYGVGNQFIKTDAEDAVREFINLGRSRHRMMAFLAIIDDRIVGSAACHGPCLSQVRLHLARLRRAGGQGSGRGFRTCPPIARLPTRG